MKPIFTLALLLGLTSLSHAQKKPTVFFLTKDDRQVFSKDSAETIRVISAPDPGSTLLNVSEFAVSNGRRTMVGKTTKIEPLQMEGICLRYYANGNRKSTTNYHKNKHTGTQTLFFPNGNLYAEINFDEPDTLAKLDDPIAGNGHIITCKDSSGTSLVTNGTGLFVGYKNFDFSVIYEQGNLKDGRMTGAWKGYDTDRKITFTETYADGKLIEGHSTDASGSYTYKKRQILPEYPGGPNNFYKYLSHTIRYPSPEVRSHIEGTVKLRFTITPYGQVKDIKLMRSVSTNIDNEARRVVAISTGWIPGMAYGKQVDYFYDLPISFHVM